jgi:hypothetical protein
VCRRIPQHRDRRLGDVVLHHHRGPAVARRSADHAVVADQEGQEIRVQVVAQEGEFQPARPDVLLGGSMVAGQREDRIRRRAHERRVDQVPHACGHRGVDEGPVPPDPVRGLRGGHHQDRPGARECPADRFRVAVLRLGDLCARQMRRPPGVPHDHPLRDAGVGETPGDPPTQAAGRATNPGQFHASCVRRLPSLTKRGPQQVLAALCSEHLSE